MAEADVMSASAKKRAAKKARDAEGGAAAEAPAPAPAPKAKAKAAASAPAAGYPAAAEPKAKAKAKAKAEPAAPEPAPKAKAKAKGKAAAAPEPEPQAKAKAKGKAKAEPAPAPAPEPAPKASAKSKSQAKGKAKAAAAPEPEPKEEKTVVVQPYEVDDGRGGDWEVSAGLSKKAAKQQEAKEEKKKIMTLMKAQGTVGGKHVAGFSQTIPGMGPAPQGGVASQSVNSTGAKVAEQIKAESAAAALAIAAAESNKAAMASEVVKVPEKMFGIVIGPKGTKIKSIQEKAGCNRIDASGEEFTITGTPETVAIAAQAIRDLATKGYSALLFEDFQENQVLVHPNYLPDIIGKKGATIIAIKDALKVEIDIPKGEPAPGRKVKLTIAGKKENAETAKEVINDIMMYGHHEITHPGEVHEEMEIEYWNYSYIIGTKGCEMRHIQKTFEVRIMIPREKVSVNENVVVVGQKTNVARAKLYIEKVIAQASEPKGRGATDKAEDYWGAEGEEEDWMKQYMYKRR